MTADLAAGNVLVVGAGPTGLLLALWLARLGTKVRIIDKHAGPGEASRAMVVHARTLEFYRQLGFADSVVRRGLTVQRAALREAGRLRGAVPLGELGAGLSAFPFFLAFPQDEHERVLVEEVSAAGIPVEWRTELVGYEQNADEVRATLRTPGGTETVNASFLAGCDGARSTVRAGAAIGFGGGTYERRFFVADAEVEGEAARDGLNICLTGKDFCIVVPLHRPGAARLIGVVPDGIDPDQVRFEDVAASVRRNTALTVRRVGWFSTYQVHHRVAERFRHRRVFLLGDAAHLHSPAGGQGMNTGLGDASNLAWKLAAVLAGRVDPALLDSYEPERIAFARRLVVTTDRMFTLVAGSGLRGKLWRKVVMTRVLPLLLKLPPVRANAFRAISQIRIAYRDSPLSQGRAGRVHAGDRLPWIADAGIGADNFVSLGALDWQIQVYGKVSPGVRSAAALRGLALHVLPWNRYAEARGLARDALYLVRPDGHVGLADGEADLATLDAYAARWSIRGRTS